MSDKPKRRTIGAAPEVAAAGEGDGSGSMFLPDGCPTIALGYGGQYLYVLDAYGQFHQLDGDRVARVRMINVCKPEWLLENYPRRKKVAARGGEEEWITIGWKPEEFHAALENTCKRAGRFNPHEQIRGRGAYPAEDGSVILHLGDRLWMGGTRGAGKPDKLGRCGDYVYPAGDELPGPVVYPVDGTAARTLLAKLASSWRFNRAIDPLFVLGQIGVLVIGGALPVRPGMALTGERGNGKSELLLTVEALLGAWARYSTDATEAGVRQKLSGDAVGVLLDEQESQADNSAFRRLQLFWRACYGGGKTWRGGQNHTGAEFTSRATLMVGAINLPPMDAQDRSRVIEIELLSLPGKLRLVHDATWPGLGQQLVRRLADQYPRLVREILPAWRALMIDNGWDNRGADTYGTVLSCAWAMLHDTAPTMADYDALGVDLDALAEMHKALEMTTDRLVMAHLLGHKVDFFRRGEQRTIGEQLMEGCGWGRNDPAEEDYPAPATAADEAINRTEQAARRAASQMDARKAMSLIKRYGIATLTATEDDSRGAWKMGERLFAIANICPALAELFRGTPWAATATGQGGWHAALLRAPTARRWPYPVRFPFGTSRVVAMRLDVALAGMVGPDGADTADAWRGYERMPESMTATADD